MEKLDSKKEITDNIEYCKLSRTKKSIIYFTKNRNKKNLVRDALRVSIVEFQEIYTNSSATNLIIKILPNKTFIVKNNKLIIFI